MPCVFTHLYLSLRRDNALWPKCCHHGFHNEACPRPQGKQYKFYCPPQIYGHSRIPASVACEEHPKPY